MYIGLRDTVGDNKLSSYEWLVDGSTITFNNFATNKPDYNVELCVFMQKNSGYKWNDGMCDGNNRALCESEPVS